MPTLGPRKISTTRELARPRLEPTTGTSGASDASEYVDINLVRELGRIGTLLDHRDEFEIVSVELQLAL
jgi:hypothetical protein